jgi:hypothetical protein
VWLDDTTSEHNVVTVRNQQAIRRAHARELCNIRVDTTHGAIDRIVEQIEAEWNRLAPQSTS